MRKICLLLVFVFVVSTLFGCGSSDTSVSEENSVNSVEIKDDSSVAVESEAESSEPSDVVSEEVSVESETESSEEESSVESSEEPEFEPMDYSDSYLKLDGLELYCVSDSAYKAFPAEYGKYEDKSWYNTTVIFKATADIKNFRLLSYDESFALCINDALKTVKTLKKGEMFIARVNINDASINRGFSYKYNSGEIYYYFAEDMSGESAFPYELREFEPEAGPAFSTVVANSSYFEYYAYYDIDFDGDNELIVKTGLDEAGAEFHFYSFMDGMAKKVGTVSAFHSMLVSDGTYLIVNGGHMSYEWADKIILSNGKIKTEEIFGRDVDFDNGDYTSFPYYVEVYFDQY